MIDDNTNSASDDFSDESNDDEISRSQRKRDADAIRDLGAHLAELGSSELATIPLPDDVLRAIEELKRLKAHGARKRQLGYLAKRLRQTDIPPIEEALENIRQAARANTRSHHLIEQWRDRLLGDADDETPKEALTQFLHEYAQADRQQMRHLQRQALTERQKNNPPTAARSLFKTIRETVLASPDAL